MLSCQRRSLLSGAQPLPALKPTPLEKTLFWLFASLIGAIAILLFVENFVFSHSVGLLGFREIDDLAFQTTLRRCHLALQEGHLGFLSRSNDYAYGWLFWVPLALITYPLFLLSQLANIDWPLIIFPRQLSLFFGFIGLYFIYKSLRLLKCSPLNAMAGVTLIALFPSFSYFCMRFGTVHELFFFSTLSLYFALSDTPSTPRGRLKIALTVAATGAIKLSGLFIAPVIAGLVWNRLPKQYKSSFKNLARTLWVPVVTFTLALIALTNPSLYAAPFNTKLATKYFATLSHFMEVTRTSLGDSTIDLFFSGFFLNSYSYVAIFGVLFCGLFYGLLKHKKEDMAVFICGIILACTYLLLSVKTSSSVTVYFTPIFFLFIFGIIPFGSHKKTSVLLALFISLMLYGTVTRASSEWGINSYFVKETEKADEITNAQHVKNCIKDDLNGRAFDHIFVDFTIPLTMNALTHPKACISVAWNNLSAEGKYCQKPIDYLILDQVNAIGMLPDEAFSKRLKAVDSKTVKNYTKDRESRQMLTKTGAFAGQAFTPICHTKRTIVYKAD